MEVRSRGRQLTWQQGRVSESWLRFSFSAGEHCWETDRPFVAYSITYSAKIKYEAPSCYNMQ